jgi:hypothetical protein
MKTCLKIFFAVIIISFYIILASSFFIKDSINLKLILLSFATAITVIFYIIGAYRLKEQIKTKFKNLFLKSMLFAFLFWLIILANLCFFVYAISLRFR